MTWGEWFGVFWSELSMFSHKENMMKKSALVLCMALLLGACGGDKVNESVATQADTQATQTAPMERYVMATEANYPPFDYRDDDGGIIGFDVDILKAIAEDQGFAVDFIHTERSKLFDNLDAGGSQILGACLGITFERLARAEISTPYAFAPNVIMSTKDNAVNGLVELSGKKVAVQGGSFSAKLLQDISNVQVSEVKSLFDAYKAFAVGEVDYVVGDAGSLEHFHKNTPIEGKDIELTVYDKMEDTRVGFAVKKGNTELLEKINTGLKNIQANGTYDKIYAQWFGDNPTMRIPAEFEGKPVGK